MIFAHLGKSLPCRADDGVRNRILRPIGRIEGILLLSLVLLETAVFDVGLDFRFGEELVVFLAAISGVGGGLFGKRAQFVLITF